MSPDWYAGVLSSYERGNGTNSAIEAAVEWCSRTKGDTRAKWIIEAEDTVQGGMVVSRVLVGGGWNRMGLDELANILENDPESFVRLVIERRKLRA